MSQKKKLSKLSASDEAALAKLSKKQRQLAVDGVPDQSDVDNLDMLFGMYDRATGGGLKRFLSNMQFEKAANGRTLTEISVDKSEFLTFAMPRDLQEFMEKYYPTIWSNKDHLRWFLKKFPAFRR